jgi:uncharacterized protein YjbJ (UPF0337 family)
MEAAGKLQKNAGKIQAVVGDFKENLKDNVNKELKKESKHNQK